MCSIPQDYVVAPVTACLGHSSNNKQIIAVCFLLGNSPASFFAVIFHTYPPLKMEQTDGFGTSARKIQKPGNYPEEIIQHSEHGESFKSETNT